MCQMSILGKHIHCLRVASARVLADFLGVRGSRGMRCSTFAKKISGGMRIFHYRLESYPLRITASMIIRKTTCRLPHESRDEPAITFM